MEGHPQLTSNIFEANFLFDKKIDGFDFFKVEGVGFGADKFKLLSKVIGSIQYQEKAPFAPYTPSPKDNYAVGYLPDKPHVAKFEVDGLIVTYDGQNALLPTPAGRRTLTDLLNKSKFRELRQILWSPGGHTFYPKMGRNLNNEERYKGCNLTMFRGPFFRYNMLSNGKIILSLDSSTHYIYSEPFLTEIRRRGGMSWFVKEIEQEREAMSARARERSYSSIYKNLPFPEEVIPDKAECKVKDGVLEVIIPKKTPTPEAKKHKVEVKEAK